MDQRQQNQDLIRSSQALQTSLISRDTLTPHEPQKQGQNIAQQKPVSQTSRLNSLDFHRGLTIFGMILANSGGDNAPQFMRHAEWNGLTAVDLIFPSFMFIMGMAVPLAVTVNKPVKLRNILRVIGLFLIGVLLYLYDGRFNFAQMRILGVLQRLSLCYGCMILVHWATGYGEVSKRIYGFLAICSGFFIYIAYMMSFQSSLPECQGKSNLSLECNFILYIDTAVFGVNHIYQKYFDPEGLFSTLPAFFTTYIGYYFCLIMKDNQKNIKKTLKQWSIIYIILSLTVYPLMKMMPLNKKIYSASYAVLSASVAGGAIIVFVLIVDILPKWSKPAGRIVNVCITPFIWMGRNPLFMYVISEVVSTTLGEYIKINDESMDTVIEKYWFNSWVGVIQVSAELKAIFYLLIYLIPTFVLFKKGIFIRL